MEIESIMQKLQQSDVFRKWRDNYGETYLVHIFLMDGEEGKIAQIGYYDPQKDVIFSFDVADSVTAIAPEKPFRNSEHRIRELNLDKVKKDFGEALVIAKRLQQEKYPNEKSIKDIVVLQALEVGQIYNITFVTQTFKTLNIKLDSSTGKLISDELISLIKFPSK